MPFGTPFYQRLIVEDLVTNVTNVELPITILVHENYWGYNTSPFQNEIKAMKDEGHHVVIPIKFGDSKLQYNFDAICQCFTSRTSSVIYLLL